MGEYRLSYTGGRAECVGVCPTKPTPSQFRAIAKLPRRVSSYTASYTLSYNGSYKPSYAAWRARGDARRGARADGARLWRSRASEPLCSFYGHSGVRPMLGRRPIPSAVRAQRGNPGRRPRGAREPEHERIGAEVPAELQGDERAIAEWQRIIVTIGRGHCTVVDRGALIGYCQAWSMWQRCAAEALTGAVLVTTASGYVMANPAITLASKALQLFLRAAVELGFTPSARTRVSAVALDEHAAPVDEFTAFQQQRRPGGAG